MFSYALATDSSDAGSVCKMVYLSHLNRVAVALTNGRIFLVRSDMSPSTSTMAEGSFVLTELGSTSLLFSLTVLYKTDEKKKSNRSELFENKIKLCVIYYYNDFNFLDPVFANCGAVKAMVAYPYLQCARTPWSDMI